MKAFLRALNEAAVRWALAMAALSVWLLLNAWLDGQPNEIDAMRATDLAVMDAVVAEEAGRP